MGDLGGLTSQLTSSSFGRDVKLGVPCLDAACTVGLNLLSVARNPDKPTQNKLKTNKTNKVLHVYIQICLQKRITGDNTDKHVTTLEGLYHGKQNSMTRLITIRPSFRSQFTKTFLT